MKLENRPGTALLRGPPASGDDHTTEDLVEAFFRRLSLHAATLDELLSDAFEVSPEAADADLGARRTAAWQRACAAGDASLFARRLERDGRSPVEVENRLA